MKKFILIISIISVILVACKPQQLTPVQKMKKAQTEAQNVEKIELPDFTFYATSVEPQFGFERRISVIATSYMRVGKKNIDAQLPYLGRFYVRPLSPLDVPVRFNSSKFVYAVTYNREDDNFDVLISPQDVSELLNRNMTIKMKMDKDGNGTVSITTDNRDEVLYRGYYR